MENIKQKKHGGFIYRDADQKTKFRPISTDEMTLQAEFCKIESVHSVLNNILDLMFVAGYLGVKKKQPNTFYFIIRCYKQIRYRITEDLALCAEHFLRSWWADRTFIRDNWVDLLVVLKQIENSKNALTFGPPLFYQRFSLYSVLNLVIK